MKQQNNMNSILFLVNCFASRPVRVGKAEAGVRPYPQERENMLTANSESLDVGVIAAQRTKRDGRR